MTVKIAKGIARGRITAPPSKSMAHRYLICGALGEGKSVISGIDFSDDVKATLDCLKLLGASVTANESNVTIGGLNPEKIKDGLQLFCNESGSTLRFLIPLCLLTGKAITLIGSERLFSRSLKVYEDICKNQEIRFEEHGGGVTLCGKLKGGEYFLPGDVSSQFISGLLFVLPLLPSDSAIHITGPLESGSYLDLTVNALEQFGITVDRPNEKTFIIKGGQRYVSQKIRAPGDYSNAAFFECLNFAGGNVKIDGLNPQSAQGDRVYRALFGKISDGCPQIDVSDCPDLAPVLMVAAAMKNGATFTGTRRLKIKESDRGAAMAAELKKFGIPVTVEENHIVVASALLCPPGEPLYGHNDHRIVMALAVLCTLTGGEIEGAEAVRKSFPDFFTHLGRIMHEA